MDEESMTMNHLLEIEHDFYERALRNSDRLSKKLDQCERNYDIILKLLRNLNGSSGSGERLVTGGHESQEINSIDAGFMFDKMSIHTSAGESVKQHGDRSLESIGVKDVMENETRNVFDEMPDPIFVDENSVKEVNSVASPSSSELIYGSIVEQRDLLDNKFQGNCCHQPIEMKAAGSGLEELVQNGHLVLDKLPNSIPIEEAVYKDHIYEHNLNLQEKKNTDKDSDESIIIEDMNQIEEKLAFRSETKIKDEKVCVVAEHFRSLLKASEGVFSSSFSEVIHISRSTAAQPAISFDPGGDLGLVLNVHDYDEFEGNHKLSASHRNGFSYKMSWEKIMNGNGLMSAIGIWKFSFESLTLKETIATLH